MIDAVAKALALWAIPYNDWDALTEEQRERWRDGARVAIAAIPRPTMIEPADWGSCKSAMPEPPPPKDIGGTSYYGWRWPWQSPHPR